MISRNSPSFLIFVLVIFCSVAWARPAEGGPVFGVQITVNTTDGGTALDGFCSLAEAITALNGNNNANNNVDGCHALGTDPTAGDGITFAIAGGGAYPLINVSPILPTISSPITIDGNTGGHTKVEVRGPGGLISGGQHGFTITGNNVGILNMVINSHRDDGVFSSGANTVLWGNIIGMNAAGTTEAANQGFGVQIRGSGAVIGGQKPGSACVSPCNVIAGNEKPNVLLDNTSTGGIVRGNFLGTDITGTVGQGGHGSGVTVIGDDATIGGATGTTPGGACTGQCNVISPGSQDGIRILAGADDTTIRGNFVGTDVTGTQKIGLYLAIEDLGGSVTVGNGSPSSRNLIYSDQYAVRTNGDFTARGNFFGPNTTGTAVITDASSGISAEGPNVTIGGPGALAPGGNCSGDCNLIAGDGVGVSFSIGATNSVVRGNYIGLNLAGTAAIANAGQFSIGLFSSAPTVFGGTSFAQRNVIAGYATGIGLSSSSTRVRYNYIGTNAAGTATLPGMKVGISIDDANNASNIGTNGEGNVIGGAEEAGIQLDFQASGVTIADNFIGVGANGTTPLPNLRGVHFRDAAQNVVRNNIIMQNGGAGIEVTSFGDTLRNTITQNSINENGELGIDLLNGGNNDQPAPALTVVQNTAGNTHVEGTLAGDAPLAFYTIEFFHSPTCDASGFGEGETYIGDLVVGAAANGDAVISTDLSTLPPGKVLTATARDALGNTSEFSNCKTVLGVPTPTPTPSPTPTASPSGSATPSPTTTGGTQLVQGDVNCDGVVDIEDFLLLIKFAAGLNDGTMPDPCPDLGEALPAGTNGHPWGDVNCDDDVNAMDALFVLAHTVEVELEQGAGCTGIGDAMT